MKLSMRPAAKKSHPIQSNYCVAQAHFLKKFGVSGIVAQIIEQRIAIEFRQSGVSLFVPTLQPFK
jgi:hypothetical protein